MSAWGTQVRTHVKKRKAVVQEGIKGHRFSQGPGVSHLLLMYVSTRRFFSSRDTRV